MKRMMYYGALCLALCAALLGGCDKGSGTIDIPIEKEDPKDPDTPNTPDPPKNAMLELSLNELVFEAAGGEKTFTVSCNGYWTVENGSDGWFRTDFTYGTGNLTVVVRVSSYTGIEDRNANLTVKSGDKVKVLCVTQKGKDAILTDKDKYEVAQDGGSISVDVKTNIASVVSEIPAKFRGWISLEQGTRAVETKRFNFTVARNDSTDLRSGYIVFIGNAVRDTVYVYQAQRDRLLLSPGSQSMPWAGGTFSVELRRNVEYSVTVPDSVDWLSLVQTRALRTDRLYFSVSKNESRDDRSAVVTVKDRNGSLSATLTVSQAGKDFLSLPGKSHAVGQAGGTVTVEAESNVSYTVTIPSSYSSWITQVPSSRATVKKTYAFKVSANETYSARSAFILLAGTAVRDTVYITQAQKDRLQVPQASYDVEESGTTLGVSLLANVEYDVTFSAGVDWVSNLSSSAARLSLGVARNDDRLPREATVTLKQRGGNLTATLRIRQAGKSYLDLLQKNYAVGQAGGTVTVEVESNVSYTVSPNESWIARQSSSVSGAKKTYLFKVSGNETFASRKGYITFVGASVKDTVYITQAQKDRLLLLAESSEFGVYGGTVAVAVETNVEYDIIIPAGAGWLSTLSSSSKYISLSISRNDSPDRREATVTLKQRGGGLTATLRIGQEGKVLSLSRKSYAVPRTGKTVSVEVNSNVSYEVSVPEKFQSWISAAPPSSFSYNTVAATECRITVSKNAEEEIRDGYVVFSNGSLTDTAYVTQNLNVMDVIGGVELEMVYVEGGTFTMGATPEQGGDAKYNEEPAHSVTLSGYYIGKFEVTQGLWKAVMENNPSYFPKGDNYPVEQVTWYDANAFAEKLSALTGKRYALPTEAQWEYAARGGKKSKGYKYSGGDAGWYSGNSGSTTHPVGQKLPNELGIYDMSGNVWEWCQDWYGDSYYSYSPSTDPTGPSSGSYRGLRGGSWYGGAAYCRVSYRYDFTPGNRYYDFGFRVVLLP